MTERNREIPVHVASCVKKQDKNGIQFESAIVELKKNTYFQRSILHKRVLIFIPYQYFKKFTRT